MTMGCWRREVKREVEREVKRGMKDPRQLRRGDPKIVVYRCLFHATQLSAPRDLGAIERAIFLDRRDPTVFGHAAVLGASLAGAPAMLLVV